MMNNNSSDHSSGPLDAILPILDACDFEVLDLDCGYVTCPGVEAHTTPNSTHDCIVYNNDGVPFLHCLHQSCRETRKDANTKLRKLAFGNRYGAKQPDDTAERERREAHSVRRAQAERERKLAAVMLPAILQDFDWPANAIAASSPDPVTLPVGKHWQLILCLFAENDVVWIGRDQCDSGSPGHRWRFQRSIDWLHGGSSCPGQFTCPSAFRPGAYQRQRKDVLTPKFLLVESDTLSRDQIGAVFRWMERSLNLPLRAVVDSGNKSLHGWFEYPPPDVFEKLRLWLPAMGCDPAMFAPNQPCRLPGAWRAETGRFQRLLYIA